MTTPKTNRIALQGNQSYLKVDIFTHRESTNKAKDKTMQKTEKNLEMDHDSSIIVVP